MAAHATSDPAGAVLTGSPSGGRRVGPVPWLVGLAAALLVMGPALAPGPLFNLDLVLPPDVPVPRGVWGLGPELPRRVPMWLPVAWLSPLVGGANAGKALMVAAVAVAFVGAYRLVADRSVVAAYGAAVLYALNPFLLTRLGVGHLMIVVPMAVLPWVLDDLAHPGRDLRRTFLGALALGFGGHYGGAVTAIVVLVGLATDGERRWRRSPAVLGLALLAQLPWLVPGIVVYAEGATIVDAAPFATLAPGVDGLGRVLAGHGFWNPLFQVGWPGGWPVALLGVLLTGLALAGHRELPAGLRRPLAVLAGIGLGLTLVSVVPGLREAWVTISRNPVGSVLREGQRAMPLFLVWQAPAAALGAWRLGRRIEAVDTRSAGRAALGSVVAVLPLAAGLVLAGPGLWGVGGQLKGIHLPPEWEEMRARIEAQPGTVVALPWHQYFDLDIDGSRRVLNPMPLYLGGDVITSSDPELAEDDRRERIDPREPAVDAIVADVVAEKPVASRLASLGVRWVVLLHEVNWPKYSPLNIDPGLERVIRAPALDLYRVRDWPGDAVVAPAGAQPAPGAAGVPVDPSLEPVERLGPSGEAVVNRPYARGWLRGTAATWSSPLGQLAVPGGDGPVWFAPTVVVLLADLATLAGVAWAVASLRRRPAPRPVDTWPHEVPPDSL